MEPATLQGFRLQQSRWQDLNLRAPLSKSGWGNRAPKHLDMGPTDKLFQLSRWSTTL